MTVKEKNLLGKGSKLYIFGSALSASTPKDIDLLIEYDSILMSLDEIIKVRIQIKKLVGDHLQKNIDICLLSTIELTSNSFVEDEGAKVIYGYRDRDAHY